MAPKAEPNYGGDGERPGQGLLRPGKKPQVRPHVIGCHSVHCFFVFFPVAAADQRQLGQVTEEFFFVACLFAEVNLTSAASVAINSGGAIARRLRPVEGLEVQTQS